MTNDLKIHVKGSLFTKYVYFSLPFCKAADHPGRWIRASLLSDEFLGWSVNQSAFERSPASALIYVPFECRYKQYSYTEFNMKVKDKFKLIHFYGMDLKRNYLQLTFKGKSIDCKSVKYIQLCDPQQSQQFLTSLPNSATLLYLHITTAIEFWSP
jgi:hypothetical protein